MADQKPKSAKLSRDFLYASAGPLVLRQLGEDESCSRMFPPEAAETVRACHGEQRSATPQELKRVMEAFIDLACPSRKGSLPVVNWVCRQYLSHRHNGKPIMAEDFYKIDGNIRYLDSLKESEVFKQSGKNPDLTQYKTYAALEETIEPFLKGQQQKEALAAAFNMTPQEKAAIMAETTVLYAGPEGTVVVPHTPRASQHWGSNTKWCIAGKEYVDTLFPHYNAKSPVIMIAPKGMADRKVALVDHNLWDSADKTIASLPQAHDDLLQRCLNSLSEGVRRGLAPWLPKTPDRESPAPDSELDRKAKEEVERLRRREAKNPVLWQQRAFVLATVRQDGRMLEYAAEELKHDREIALAAVQQHVEAIYSVAEELKRDRAFVLAVVRQNVSLLFEDSELQRDREIVLAAVRQNGRLLHYAAKELQRDREIVLAAVQQNGGALYYAAKKLKGNRTSMLYLLENAEELSFQIRNHSDVWQPDDGELRVLQVKAIEKMAAAGDREKFVKYARHFKETWGDPERLFNPDMTATVTAIKTSLLSLPYKPPSPEN